MRLISWDMGCGGPSRFRKTHDAAWEYLIEELRPDVALVQETLKAAADWLKGRGELLMSTDTNPDNGAAIFVRSGLRPIPVPMACPHAFLAAADITSPEGALRAVSVHLYPHSGKAHQDNLRALLDTLTLAANGRRFVVGGDINASRRFDVICTAESRTVTSSPLPRWRNRELHDCHFGLHAKEERTFWGQGEYQLDHFFVESSRARSVRACEVLTTAETQRLSDHSPVLLELD